MTRTTIDLDPDLLEELKHIAARGRESMSRAANRLLHKAVRDEREAVERTPPLRWHVVEGGSFGPGFDPANRDYLDLLDEDP
jgi:hypothetical protein